MEDLQALLEELPTLYLDKIVDYLAVLHKIHISTTVLHDNHKTLRLTYKRMHRTASQWDQEARQAWHDDIAIGITPDYAGARRVM